jgi:short-subunit dehydrogenase
MEAAIVTGASSGIGRAVVKRLASRGYRVFGLARSFEKSELETGTEAFVPKICDLTDTKHLIATATAICEETQGIAILVNNAGVGRFGPHETLAPEAIETMVATNLTAPLVLTGALLRSLRDRRGTIINIASTAALHPHRQGAAYAATKAGLLQFGEALFDEVRKSGVKVTTILPDMVRETSFYKTAAFEPATDPGCHLTPACVADAVELVLDARTGTVPTQIVLKPQRVGIDKKPRSKGI